MNGPISKGVSSAYVRAVSGRSDTNQHGGRKLTETAVTAFYYKSENLPLEELKNIKIIFFPTHEVFR